MSTAPTIAPFSHVFYYEDIVISAYYPVVLTNGKNPVLLVVMRDPQHSSSMRRLHDDRFVEQSVVAMVEQGHPSPDTVLVYYHRPGAPLVHTLHRTHINQAWMMNYASEQTFERLLGVFPRALQSLARAESVLEAQTIQAQFADLHRQEQNLQKAWRSEQNKRMAEDQVQPTDVAD